MRWPVAVLLLATATIAAAESTLQHVDVLRAREIAVRLDLTAPVEPIVCTLPATNGLPPRIYLDLPGTVLGKSALPVTDGVADLVRVRTGQFDPQTARVVLDLTGPLPYVVRRDGTSITVELATTTSSAPAPAPIPAPAPPPAISRQAPPRPDSASRVLVVVDAGHGGRDPGATGIDGVLEKTMTLDLARRLAARLPDRLPVDVVLTRHDDDFVAIDERIARAADAALFISLHANASLDARQHGIEVFFGGGGATAAASGLGRPIYLGLAVIEALEQRLGAVRTLMRPGDYGVVARNAVPSVLIEVGYLTNPADAARLRDTDYRTLLTDAVVDAVDAFLQDRLAS